MKTPDRARDNRDLMALHLVESEQFSCTDAGKKLGITKSAVIGMRWRVNTQEVNDLCVKPENQDGGMPNLWWRDWCG